MVSPGQNVSVANDRQRGQGRVLGCGDLQTKVQGRKFQTRPEKASGEGWRGEKTRADRPKAKNSSCSQGGFVVSLRAKASNVLVPGEQHFKTMQLEATTATVFNRTAALDPSDKS